MDAIEMHERMAKQFAVKKIKERLDAIKEHHEVVKDLLNNCDDYSIILHLDEEKHQNRMNYNLLVDLLAEFDMEEWRENVNVRL